MSKTIYILFQKYPMKLVMPPATIEGTTLNKADRIKFLGVYIDENINWNYQIHFIATKLSRICGILYRVRNNLTTEAFTSIYYTLCYPHLIYCVSVWARTWPSFSIKLTIAQNETFRSIFYMKRFDSTKSVHSVYKSLNFENIHKYLT